MRCVKLRRCGLDPGSPGIVSARLCDFWFGGTYGLLVLRGACSPRLRVYCRYSISSRAASDCRGVRSVGSDGASGGFCVGVCWILRS